MRRTPLYSRTPASLPSRPRTDPAPAGTAGATMPPPDEPEITPGGAQLPPGRAVRGRLERSRRTERWLWAVGAACLAVAAGWPGWTAQRPSAPTLEQIDAHMRESIAKEPLAAAAAAAYAAVRPSVVRVVGTAPAQAGAAVPGRRAGRAPAQTPAPPHGEDGRSVGTGVVVVDNGLILTNLHVVAGAQRITVSFADGSESEADLVNLQPENDLAVLRARVVPDDLHAATLRSTADLAPGDEVIAVGFPFGIGPSASQGVVSGLKREFRSPEGERVLANLIQFDAAANPGNSGGPLVTMDGHVVGIVTAILNPSPQRTFIGIGFAVPIESAAAAAGMPPF